MNNIERIKKLNPLFLTPNQKRILYLHNLKNIENKKEIKPKIVKKKVKKKRKVTTKDKKIVAGRQGYKCANKPYSSCIENYECPMWIKGDGSFDESGFDIDHINEFIETQNDNLDNLQALCKTCHYIKTSRFNSKRKRKTN